MLSLWVEWGKCDPSGSFLAPQTLRLCLKCVSHCFRFLLTSPIAEEGVLRGRRRGKGVGKGGGRRREPESEQGRSTAVHSPEPADARASRENSSQR